jgi:sialate O-acetylesterase
MKHTLTMKQTYLISIPLLLTAKLSLCSAVEKICSDPAGWPKAELRVAGVFGDHMVLQLEIAVPVWGWAASGETVRVTFAGQEKSATADADGKWIVRLEPMKASPQPRDLTVAGTRSGESITYTDVVVGEVWVLGGQSNMGWGLERSTGGDEAIKCANYPWLRYFSQGRQHSDSPASDVVKGAKWQTCTPNTAGAISGVGFFFALTLHASKEVPIGLIHTAVSSTYGESWISRAVLEADPFFAYSLEAYAKALTDYPAKAEEWNQKKAEYAQLVEEAKKAGKPAPVKSDFVEYGPMSPTHFRRPGALYHGRVCPIQPYAIRGMIWYQGEGDAQIKLAERYFTLLSTLARCWRADWKQGDFPILIVQLPRYDYDNPWSSYPLLREAQLRGSQKIPNAGLVVTIDEGGSNIHPPNKQPVGERLARLARDMVYGEAIEGTGPLYESMEIKDGNIILRFSHVAGNLRRRLGDLRGFMACGADKVFHPALAEITGKNTVRVTCADVAAPVAVRYAWAPAPDCNLVNSDGLPASPFRTDDFDTGHYLPRETNNNKR